MQNSELVNQLIEIDVIRKIIEIVDHVTYSVLEKAKDVEIEIAKENV